MNVKAIAQANAKAQSETSQNSRWTLETPEYLLLLVVLFVIWIVGFLELFTHTSKNPTLFGLYSPGFFGLVVAHGSVLLLILGLFTRPHRSAWLVKTIAYIQDRWWLWGSVVAAAVGLIVATYSLQQIERFPGLHLSLVALSILLILVITFAGWGKQAVRRPWRKVGATLLAIIVIIEVALQGLAYAGALSTAQPIARPYTTYSRVYQTEQGFGYGTTNQNGWYYPEFKLAADSKKLFLLGDTYLQGLQVKPTENLGVLLENHLAEAKNASPETEVIGLGFPGFGPGLYADVPLLEHLEPEFVAPDEIIVFFNLAYDFQTVSGPSQHHLYFEVDEAGAVEIHPDNWQIRHDLQHYVLDGFAPIHVLDMLTSHYLTVQMISHFLYPPPVDTTLTAQTDPLGFPGLQSFVYFDGARIASHRKVDLAGVITAPIDNNFVFATAQSEKAETAFAIAADQLSRLHAYTQAKNIPLRLVTIPVFPAAFYEAYQGDSWNATIGGYDLWLPEARLQTFAREQGIDFLGMGHYMEASGLSVAEIQALYFAAGQGHFTPQGHAYFAEAVYACFFAADKPAACRGETE